MRGEKVTASNKKGFNGHVRSYRMQGEIGWVKAGKGTAKLIEMAELPMVNKFKVKSVRA